MNTDNLYQLDDAELSGLFAEKVARLKSICIKAIVNPRIEHYTYSAPTKDNPYLRLPLPSFATSADAVLPWLEKHTWRGCSYCSPHGDHRAATVEVFCERDSSMITVQSTTLPRAACIALIRAKRRK